MCTLNRYVANNLPYYTMTIREQSPDIAQWFRREGVSSVDECKQLNRLWSDMYRNTQSNLRGISVILDALMDNCPGAGFTRWADMALELYSKEGLGVATADQWAELLRLIYVNGEDNRDLYCIREVLSNGPMEVIDALRPAGGMVTVYRGVCLDKGAVLSDDIGLSWTQSKSIAEWFSKRWRAAVEVDAYLIEGKVNISDCIMSIGSEEELVLWSNPDNLVISQLSGPQETSATGGPLWVSRKAAHDATTALIGF